MDVGTAIQSSVLPVLFGKIVRLYEDNTAIIETVDKRMNPRWLLVNLDYWHEVGG